MGNVTREMLNQYLDLQSYIDEIESKIESIKFQIEKLEKRITQIESGEKVIDSVNGGLGGTQHFRIEGVPSSEYAEKKTRLYLKKLAYEDLNNLLEEQRKELLGKRIMIEKFIARIDDISIRRIINLRFIENYSWDKVAISMGLGYTEDSIKKMFYRFMGKQ